MNHPTTRSLSELHELKIAIVNQFQDERPFSWFTLFDVLNILDRARKRRHLSTEEYDSAVMMLADLIYREHKAFTLLTSLTILCSRDRELFPPYHAWCNHHAKEALPTLSECVLLCHKIVSC